MSQEEEQPPLPSFDALSCALYGRQYAILRGDQNYINENQISRSPAAISSFIYGSGNKPNSQTIRAFAIDPLSPGNKGPREIYDCIKLYGLTVERVPLLNIQEGQKQDDNDAIAKLASANGINGDYVFPIYQTTKRDGTTVNYRKDSADKFADKGNYVVFPKSFEQTTSYDVPRIDVEDLLYRQRLLQIPGIAPVREIMQAAGEEQLFHEAIRPVNNNNLDNVNNLSASMLQPQPEQSTTTYYEPANCTRIDCPVCLTGSKEAMMVLLPVGADGNIIRSYNNDNNNNSAKYECTNCGKRHSILDCAQL